MYVKTKMALCAASVLILCGAACAEDGGRNHHDGRNAVQNGAHAAFTANAGPSHAPNHHVKSSLTPEHAGALFDSGSPSHGRKPTPLDFHLAQNPFERSDDFVW
jgi:hypothetical protein